MAKSRKHCVFEIAKWLVRKASALTAGRGGIIKVTSLNKETLRPGTKKSTKSPLVFG